MPSPTSSLKGGRDSPPPRQPSPEPSFAPLSAMPRRRRSSSNSARPSHKDLLSPSIERPERLRLARSCDGLLSERERRRRMLLNKLDGLSSASSSPPSTPRSLPITLSPPSSPVTSVGSSPSRTHRKSFSSAIPRLTQFEAIPPVPPLPSVYSRTRTMSSASTTGKSQPLEAEVEPMTLPLLSTAASDRSMRTKFKSKILRHVSSRSTLSSPPRDHDYSGVGCGGMTCAKFFSLSRPTVTVSSH